MAEPGFVLKRPRFHETLMGLLGLLLLLAAWVLAALRIGDSLLLPGPLEVLRGLRAVVADGSLALDVAASLERVLLGFLIAAALAVPLALALAAFRPARLLLMPALSVLRPIPPIAWIPLSIVWFGLGNGTSYFVTAVAAFFPVFLNAVGGGLAVEIQHLRAARCLGAGPGALLRFVYLPSALPSVWTGLRVGLGQSWMAVVTAEMVSAQSGLGYMIEVNRLDLETSRVLVGMGAIALTGALMTWGLGRMERAFLPWKRFD